MQRSTVVMPPVGFKSELCDPKSGCTNHSATRALPFLIEKNKTNIEVNVKSLHNIFHNMLCKIIIKNYTLRSLDKIINKLSQKYHH